MGTEGITIMQETWKEIENTGGKYLISNFGRLKTTSHNVKNRQSDKRFIKGVIRKTTPRKDGYYIAAFYLDGKRWSDYVHRLVWKYFGNDLEPNRKMTIDHIDNDKSNNNILNLRRVSNRENVSKGMLLKQKRKNSKYIGIYWRKLRRRWYSRIQHLGKRIYLGSYKTEIEAHGAYQTALQKLAV